MSEPYGDTAVSAMRIRAERAEAEVALLRSAGSRLLDALEGVAWQSCTEEWMLAHGMLIDALATTSASPPEPK